MPLGNAECIWEIVNLIIGSLRPSHVQTHIALQMVIKVDGVTAPPSVKSSRLTSSVCFLLHPIKIIHILTFFWVGHVHIWSVPISYFGCSHCFQLVIASLPANLANFFFFHNTLKQRMTPHNCYFSELNWLQKNRLKFYSLSQRLARITFDNKKQNVCQVYRALLKDLCHSYSAG